MDWIRKEYFMNEIDKFELSNLIAPLQEWFTANARVLPWRSEPKAYYVWVSEIMLQQTRVEAVKPYFDRFIKRLPDVEALANCPEDELLKLWEGLGYYNRVRNLKAAAQQIMEQYQGEVPQDYQELIGLKGIGAYTAGAISSIAYGKPVPAVDGNVLRVLSRVTGDDSDIAKESVKKAIQERLLRLMQESRDEQPSMQASKEVQDSKYKLNPSLFNQGLMELGATVCLPNGAPRCDACPWAELCVAKATNQIDRLPVKSKAKERRIEQRTVLVVKDGEQLALNKRPGKGLLAGLYELPNYLGHLSPEEVVDRIKGIGLDPVRIQPLGEAKHIFSHVEWQMQGYVVFLTPRDYGQNASKDGWIFVDVEETKEKYAIPSAFAAYTKAMNMVLGKDALEKKIVE